jgi:hypothetical protein
MNQSDVFEFTNTVYLHFRMIFKNTIQKENLKDVNKIAGVLKKIVEETELPDLPKTSVSYKIVNKILPFVDWKKIAQDTLEDCKKL